MRCACFRRMLRASAAAGCMWSGCATGEFGRYAAQYLPSSPTAGSISLGRRSSAPRQVRARQVPAIRGKPRRCDNSSAPPTSFFAVTSCCTSSIPTASWRRCSAWRVARSSCGTHEGPRRHPLGRRERVPAPLRPLLGALHRPQHWRADRAHLRIAMCRESSSAAAAIPLGERNNYRYLPKELYFNEARLRKPRCW
jgi:hypothetical protein